MTSQPMLLDAKIGIVYPSLHLEISLGVPAGTVMALVGSNGSGKTTALRAIAGLRPLDAGRITISGVVVDDPTTDTFVAPRDRRIGVVFQDYRLFPHLSALDNVAFGLRQQGHKRRAAREIALGWLDRVGVASHRDQRPATLSGGQSQRVALARALATAPEVLLLDEPLAAIDPRARERLRSELSEHLASFDGAVILVTHDHDDVEAFADKVVTFSDGQVLTSVDT